MKIYRREINRYMNNEWNILDKFIAYLRWRKIYKFIPRDYKAVVCDVGCGTNGDFLHNISENIEKGYGFDMKAQNHISGNIEIRNTSDIQKGLPLSDDTADCVFMLAVLEHLNNPEAMIDEIYRILKPGGILVLTTPTRQARWMLEFMAFKLHIINEDEIMDHKHYFIKDEIIKLFNEAKFTNHGYKLFLFGLNSLAYAKK